MNSYNQLVQAIIRPDRDTYLYSQLGYRRFKIGSKKFRRNDFQITSVAGFQILCSHFQPKESQRKRPNLPCIIYLHGNSSNRLQAFPLIQHILPLNITLLCFDWPGCGNSQGEYISLGWFEKEDLKNLIEHIRLQRRVSQIGLWGRSMGAVAAILYSSLYLGITAMVLDSPYSKFKTLAFQMCKKRSSAPKFVLNILYKFIRNSIQKKAGFSLDQLKPIEWINQCFVPVIFIAGNKDELVGNHHVEQLHMKYQGSKEIIIEEGDHNSVRPQKLIKHCIEYFFDLFYKFN